MSKTYICDSVDSVYWMPAQFLIILSQFTHIIFILSEIKSLFESKLTIFYLKVHLPNEFFLILDLANT